jgi:5-formyltetrahydrofolate cyclo-ligase
MRRLRDAMPADERARRSAVITRRLFGLDGFGHARTVMLFSSFGSEVDTAPLIARLDEERRRVALPRTKDHGMLSVAYRPGDPVSVAPFGAMEPAGGTIVAPEEIDAVLVPGLAFDRAGYRVGYGGGFFDRFLAKTRTDALRVGICFALQVVGEVPRGAADLPVDVIVTDEETLRCR